jgi:CxxC motif-containing protein (DUF1111 family)
VPTLVQFAADAYMNEMGITTQHCIGGNSVTAFATESAPNGVPVAAGCDDNLFGTDDQVGSCSGGLTEIQDDVAAFTLFMTFLSPPPSSSNLTATADNTTQNGQRLFANMGCDDCHSSQTFTTPRNPANG